jgi:hypothetical protein
MVTEQPKNDGFEDDRMHEQHTNYTISMRTLLIRGPIVTAPHTVSQPLLNNYPLNVIITQYLLPLVHPLHPQAQFPRQQQQLVAVGVLVLQEYCCYYCCCW